MVYNQKMEDIFREDIDKLVKDVRSKRESVAAMVVNSIRRHNKKEKEITPENVLEDLVSRKKYWKNITAENESFQKVIEYYIFWETLNKEEKEKYRQTRREIYNEVDLGKVREYVYDNLIYGLREQGVYLGSNLFRVVYETIISIEAGTEKDIAVSRNMEKYEVKREEIEETMTLVGY